MAWARRKVGIVAANSAVEGYGTLLNEVRAARNRSAVRWTLADGLRRICGDEVSPRTRRKSARSASGRAPLRGRRRRRRGRGCWRVRRRLLVASIAVVGRRWAGGGRSGSGGEKESVKSAEESWRADRQPAEAARTRA
eukprot:2686730-Pleurochrysis_carterae.AAC.1